jgi:alpha/beta hydrolase fold
MRNWPFPFFLGHARVGGMARSFDDVLIAEFHLRLGRTVLEAQIYWPPRPVLPVAASLVLLLADEARPYGADLLGRGLSAGAEVVVLRVPDRAQTLAALMWAADHAHELGGQRDRLMVAGDGVSGARAARLAMIARDNSWPVLQRQVLVHPRSGGCDDRLWQRSTRRSQALRRPAEARWSRSC